MSRTITFLIILMLVTACATQQHQPVINSKPVVEQRVEVQKLPDRPLAFGEEYVFSIEKGQIDVAALESYENADSEECLISQMPTENAEFDNIADFVQQNMKRKWIKPRNLSKKYQCEVALQFSADGCVTEIDITGCKDNIQLVRSIETALFRSAPFPNIGGALAGDQFQFEFFAGP